MNAIYRAIFGQPKNLLDFLNDFCEEKWSSSSKPLQQFYDYIKGPEENKCNLLIKAFGVSHYVRVLKELDTPTQKCCEIYFRSLFHDFYLTERYNLETVKAMQVTLNPLPPSEPCYSWMKKGVLDTVTSSKYAQANVLLFFQSAEFPLELAIVLNFIPSKLLDSFFEEKRVKLNSSIAAAYKFLKILPDSLTLPVEPTQSIHYQLSWLQCSATFEAYADEYKLFSYAEEMIHFAREQGKDPQICFKQLKIFELINLFDAEKKSLKKASLGNFIFNDSFQHYLIKKTLIEIKNFCPISKKKLDKLARSFEEFESDRRLVCFYLYFFGDLFDTKFSFLKKFLGLKEGESRLNILNLAETITLRVLKNADGRTCRLLTGFLYLFYFDNAQKIEMKPSLKKEIFNWVNQLCKKAFCFEVSGYNAEREIAYAIKIFEKLWHLCPKPFYRKLIKAFFQADSKIKNSILDCLCQLNAAFEYALENFEDSFKTPEAFLREYIHPSENSIYYLLDLYWHFLFGVYYFNLKEEGKNLLYDRLLESNPEERLLYVNDIRSYAESIYITAGKNPWECKRKCIRGGLKKTIENNKDSPFEEIAAHWPESFDETQDSLCNVALKVVLEIESFSQCKLPLLTVINVAFAYPIYHSLILDALRDLNELRHQILFNESFFLPAELVKKKEDLCVALQEFSISSFYLGAKEHMGVKLMWHFGIARNCLERAILPYPKFAKTLSKTVGMLCPVFSKKQRHFYRKFQNIYHFCSDLIKESMLYQCHWIEGKYPSLEITFIHSMQYPESRVLTFFLQIESKKLKPELISFLKAMLINLLPEYYNLNWENQNENEFDQFLSLFPELSDLWVDCQKAIEEQDIQEIKSNLTTFIKNVKIETRNSIQSFFNHSFKDIQILNRVAINLSSIASEGNIFVLPTGLSLIPPCCCYLDKEGFYSFDKEGNQKQLRDLCEQIEQLNCQVNKFKKETLIGNVEQILIFRDSKFEEIDLILLKDKIKQFFNYLNEIVEVTKKKTTLQKSMMKLCEYLEAILKNFEDFKEADLNSLLENLLKFRDEEIDTNFDEFERRFMKEMGRKKTRFEDYFKHQFLGGVEYPMDVVLNPYPISYSKIKHYKGKEKNRGFYYEITVIIKAEKPIEFSGKLKHIAGHPDLNNFLLWMITKAIGLYYKKFL